MNDADILATAKQEEARLLPQLEALPVYRKFQAVRRIIELYSPQPERPAAAVRHVAPPPAKLDLRGSKSAVMRSVVADLLKESGRRATSGELVKALGARGIPVGGKKPSATLASYLSNSSVFDNVSGQGYGLAEWGAEGTQTERESETPDSSKLSGASSNGVLPLNS